MSSLSTLIKLQKTRVDEQRLILAKMREQLALVEGQIVALVLEQEAQTALLNEDSAFALTYGEYLKQAIKKMEALEQKKRGCEQAVRIAHDKLAEVFEEQKRYELAEQNRIEEEEREEQRRETHTLDEIGSISFQRKKKKK